MLANNARQSVKNSNQSDPGYPPGDGSWSNSKMWYFLGNASITKTYTGIQPIYPDSKDLSISIWFKLLFSGDYSDYNNKYIIKRFYNVGEDDYRMIGTLRIQAPNNGNLKFGFSKNNSASSNPIIFFSVEHNEMFGRWNNITLTYDESLTSGAVKAYLNGVFQTQTYNDPEDDFGLYSGTITDYNISFGNCNQLLISQYGEWDTVLDPANVTAIFNQISGSQNGYPIDLTQAVTNYTNASNLNVYYRFGDSTLDNVNSKLHDETNSSNSLSHADSDGDRDFDYSGWDGSGTIVQANIF
jgi:hypothetical protein